MIGSGSRFQHFTSVIGYRVLLNNIRMREHELMREHDYIFGFLTRMVCIFPNSLKFLRLLVVYVIVFYVKGY